MTPSTPKGLVLFGHGARDPQWAVPMQNLQQRLRQLLPSVRCELAFLELMEPDLPTCVNALVDEGCNAVNIVPIFFGQGGHLKKDFPLLLQALQSQHPLIAIHAHSHVGQWEAVWETIAQGVVQQLGKDESQSTKGPRHQGTKTPKPQTPTP